MFRKLLLINCFALTVDSVSLNAEPRAPKENKVMTNHGTKRVDPYYWMNQRDDPKVLKYIAAENKWADEKLKPVETIEKRLFAEMKARVKKTDQSVPVKIGEYWYYTRVVENQEYPLYCRKFESMDAEEEIYLNQNELAKGHNFFSLGDLSVSDDGKLLAWSEDKVGRRVYTIKFKEIESGKVLPTTIKESSGAVVWAADNKTFFFETLEDKTNRSYKVFRQVLNSKKAPELVFHEKDTSFYTDISRSRSRKYIKISSNSTVSREVQLIEAKSPKKKPKVFLKRQTDHRYYVEDLNGKFYILSNDKAPNNQIFETEAGQTNRKNWRVVVPHRSEVLLTEFTTLDQYLVVKQLEGGFNRMRVYPKPFGKSSFELEFPGYAYTVSGYLNPIQDTTKFLVSYQSMVQPASIYEIDLQTKKQILRKQAFAGKDFESSNYESKRVYARAKDGTAVPITLAYRTDKTNLSKPAPTLLQGYGSYGATVEPFFSQSYLSLLDRGFVVAWAHIRGGKMLGRKWYEDGKLMKKRNTFTDFIDSGEFLIKSGITAENQLFALGGSAGGLLMGAVFNMRPDLWRGVIAKVPFVDVVTTMLDDSIPLTTFEYNEWGNPNEKAAFHYMLTYSPYDQILKQDYPALLVTTGYHDSQVQYWEPTKWVAKLRDYRTNKKPLLFKTDMEAGHSGTTGRFKALKERASDYAFILGVSRGML